MLRSSGGASLKTDSSVIECSAWVLKTIVSEHSSQMQFKTPLCKEKHIWTNLIEDGLKQNGKLSCFFFPSYVSLEKNKRRAKCLTSFYAGKGQKVHLAEITCKAAIMLDLDQNTQNILPYIFLQFYSIVCLF